MPEEGAWFTHSVSMVLINLIWQLLATQEVLRNVDKLLHSFKLKGHCPVSRVRTEEHIVQFPQGALSWQRLCCNHIQASAPDVVLLQGCNKLRKKVVLVLVTNKQHLLHGRYHVKCGLQQACDQAKSAAQ